jgi:hypothetical protein
MGNRILQLSDGANWEQFYSTSVNAVTINEKNYVPIPEITVASLVYSHIIAVLVTCANAKPTWHFAGFLNQKINLGITVGSLPDTDSVQKRKLYLDRITLIIFPKLVTNYSISFEVPKWFEQVSIILWQYTGPESDSTEDLINEIKNVDLPRIEAKIDAL